MMKDLFYHLKKMVFIPLFGLVILSGCSHDPPPPQLDYAKGAITVDYQAEKDLNLYNNKSHTIVIVVYQLTDVNGFNNLAASQDGLRKLLSAESFDQTVTTVTKQYLEPGSAGSWKLDRAAETKHVGIAAGFYELLPEKSAILVDLSYDTSRHGWTLKKMTTVNPLDVTLVFGSDGLRLKEKSDAP